MNKKEIRVQLALGTYKYWYISIAYTATGMCDSLLESRIRTVLEQTIPKYKRKENFRGWWYCIASDQQISQLWQRIRILEYAPFPPIRAKVKLAETSNMVKDLLRD